MEPEREYDFLMVSGVLGWTKRGSTSANVGLRKRSIVIKQTTLKVRPIVSNAATFSSKAEGMSPFPALTFNSHNINVLIIITIQYKYKIQTVYFIIPFSINKLTETLARH